MARRTARQIRDLLARYVSVDQVEREFEAIRVLVVPRVRRIADDLTAEIMAIPEPRPRALVKCVMLAHIDGVLRELAATLQQPPPLPTRPTLVDPVMTPPPSSLRASPTLAAARARGARLHAQLIEIRERIVPYSPVTATERNL